MPGPEKDQAQRVLILEEEPFVRDTLKIKLAAQKVITATAFSEEEARKLVLSKPPDAIIIDILHHSIPGYGFIQWLKGHPLVKDIPIIILTYKEKDPEMEFIYNVWAEEYFTKPFSPREVVKRVMDIIR